MRDLLWCKQYAPGHYIMFNDEKLEERMKNAADRDQALRKSLDKRNVAPTFVEYDKRNRGERIQYVLLEIARELNLWKVCNQLLLDKTVRNQLDKNYVKAYSNLITMVERMGDSFLQDGVIERWSVTRDKTRLDSHLSFEILPKKVVNLSMYTDASTDLSIRAHVHHNYVVENMIAEKMTAILSEQRFTRPADMYDIYCLCDTYSVDYYYLADRLSKNSDLLHVRFTERSYLEYFDIMNMYCPKSNFSDVDVAPTSWDIVVSKFVTLLRELMSHVSKGYDSEYVKLLDKAPTLATLFPLRRNNIPDLENVIVPFGETALYMAGLLNKHEGPIKAFTLVPVVERIKGGLVEYRFNPDLGINSYVSISKGAEDIRIPNQERALVETILYFEDSEGDALRKAMRKYVRENKNFDKLYEVAEEFDCEKEKVLYWIDTCV